MVADTRLAYESGAFDSIRFRVVVDRRRSLCVLT